MKAEIAKRFTRKYRAALALASVLEIDALARPKGWLYDQLRQHRYKWDGDGWIYAPGIQVGTDHRTIKITIESDRLILDTVANLVIRHLQTEDLVLTHRHQDDDRISLELRVATTK